MALGWSSSPRAYGLQDVVQNRRLRGTIRATTMTLLWGFPFLVRGPGVAGGRLDLDLPGLDVGRDDATAFVVVASIGLWTALIGSDFSLRYVAAIEAAIDRAVLLCEDALRFARADEHYAVPQNTFQFADSVSWFKGNHNIRFGANIILSGDNAVLIGLAASLVSMVTAA